MNDTDQMHRAQQSVNARFTYVSDQKKYGVSEHYQIPEKFRPDFRGDCDDYATEVASVLKATEDADGELTVYHRRQVIKALQSGEFRIWRVITNSGNGHAVLEVRVDGESWFICNMGKRWRKDPLLPGWKKDKVRSWREIQQKMIFGRLGDSLGGRKKTLGAAVVAAVALIAVLYFLQG